MVIRDFVYLDIERLKSIIAQAEYGYAVSASRSQTTTQGVSGGIEGGILSVVKDTAEAQSLRSTEEAETRSLHDYIYNRVEEALVHHGLLRRLPEDLRARQALEHFNPLGEFVARASVLPILEGASAKVRKDILRQKISEMSLDKEFLKGMRLWFDIFYQNCLVLKMTPVSLQPAAKLVGNLAPSHLRDDMDSIVFKYTSRPTSEWTLLGQVAAIPGEPPENEEDSVRRTR